MREDGELYSAWNEGDREAGSELFRRFFPSVLRFFRSKLAGSGEDLIQETFLRCLQASDRFRGASSFRTFLFGIAHRVLLTHLRDRAKHPVLAGRSMKDLEPTPSSVVARHQQSRLLLLALRELPLEQQVVLELAYWESMKGPEIAEVLELPANTVRSRLARGRAALREILQSMEADPELVASTVGDLDHWAAELRADLLGGEQAALDPVDA